MAPKRPMSFAPLVAAMTGGAVVASLIAWRLNLQAVDRRIQLTRAGLKKLSLTHGIPPNQEVMDYLTARGAALEERYQSWLKAAMAPPLAEAALADPQLYFQEHLHEVQQMLERAATARSLPVPEQLGFPKELPPSDTVPRLLAQLSLINELTTLMFEQGVAKLSSFKIEDPEIVLEDGESRAFLMRLPVRVRLTSSLPQLMKVLGAVERSALLIDLRALRINPIAASDQLEAELVLSRSLLAASTPRTSEAP